LRLKQISLDKITFEIKKQKVCKIKNLIYTLNCSVWTLFHNLKECGYYTSINFNRQYITLKDIPEFDVNGIWKYQGVLFSKWGNVEKTIIGIINMSPTGCSVNELANIFNMRIHNQLHRCVKAVRLVRVRYGRNQIYLSIDDKLQKKQKEEYERISKKQLIEPSMKPSYITNKIIIDILVAVIKYHTTTSEKIISILESEGTKVSERAIKWIFDKYEIEKKGSR